MRSNLQATTRKAETNRLGFSICNADLSLFVPPQPPGLLGVVGDDIVHFIHRKFAQTGIGGLTLGRFEIAAVDEILDGRDTVVL